MKQGLTDKQALQYWEDFRNMIFTSTTVDISETEEAKAARMKWLEKPGNELEWIKYYFPKFCFKPFAKFHIRSIKRSLSKKRFRQWRKWFRSSSKSTIRMMENFYRMFVLKYRTNALLISKTYDNAERLLQPYKINFEANQRLINDYGIQEKPGSWTAGEFTTRSGHNFRAVGAEQNPRGARLDELRITMIIFDDVDDDEVSRNPDRVQQRWDWIEKAVVPTVDISGDYLIFFDNNLIAEDSCAARFADMADDVDEVNIRDENGNSTWPEKNSEADIDEFFKGMSEAAIQAEYFNNPYIEGKVFDEMTFGKCPKLHEYPFIVVYADPSPSNKDKPTLKSKNQNSCKAVVVMGYSDQKFYMHKCWVNVTNNDTFIDWLYTANDLVKGKNVVYNYIENNGLQNPFYEQILLPLIHEKGKQPGRTILGVTPDDRDKPEKFFRVEANLQHLNKNGLLILNEDEKNDPHMKKMVAQFKSVSPTSRTMDGPDATEGAVFKIKEKIALHADKSLKAIKKPVNQKRF